MTCSFNNQSKLIFANPILNFFLDSQNRGNPPTFKLPGDELLGFEAAVAALGMHSVTSPEIEIPQHHDVIVLK